MAQNYLVLDAMTKGFFSVSLSDFAGITKSLDYNSADKYAGVNNSWEITLPEIGQMLFGAGHGATNNATFSEQVRHNLRKNGGKMVANLVLIPVAFKYGQKLLGKNLIRPANRLLAPAGVRL